MLPLSSPAIMVSPSGLKAIESTQLGCSMFLNHSPVSAFHNLIDLSLLDAKNVPLGLNVNALTLSIMVKSCNRSLVFNFRITIYVINS